MSLQRICRLSRSLRAKTPALLVCRRESSDAKSEDVMLQRYVLCPRADPDAYKDRWASEASEKYTKVEEVPGHWHYVERLLPLKAVPEPPKHEGVTPSGWRPPPSQPPQLAYFVPRTRNHMLPVYLRKEIRGPRFITQVKHVEGDVWALHNDLKEYLESLAGKEVLSQVHELGSYVGYKGAYVEEVKEWLYNKGF
uniref:Large ribosomal subunit protein mL49 n=1 Tax=Hyalomma excavatum TaxID=257692 RepID=A0A131XGN5_9ACAR